MPDNVKWTEDQLNAIEKKGGAVVVSAAAGSGKTAVLVERVIRLLTDGDNAVKPEKLLIVTFTRAAASEMKHKIKTALHAKAVQNKTAREALNNIDRAVIATMDSFCLNLVRENFELAGVSPDFKTMESSELNLVSSNALNDVLDEYYSSKDEAFESLAELFMSRRDDRQLADGIKSLHSYSMSYPYPEEWLDFVCKNYRDAQSPIRSIWGKYVKSNIENNMRFAVTLLKNCAQIAESDEFVASCYGAAVYADLDNFTVAYNKIRGTSEWNEIRAVIQSVQKLTRLSSKKGINNYSRAAVIKSIRSQITKITGKLLAITDFTEQNFYDDINFLLPLVEKMIEITKKYHAKLNQLKEERNSYYFNDILHLAIDLLYEKTDAGVKTTELCKKLTLAYDAVLIDEYQDTTRAQDALFSAISDSGKKMFVVGDVKQSIYGFRLATPDIFTEKCETAYRCEENKFPMRIILGKNFRSRAGVLDFVNFVFSQIMSSETGGVDYNSDEYLYYGGSDAGAMSDVDILLCKADKDTAVYEARNIGCYINKVITDKTMITVKGETREVCYSDFCILLRAVKGKAEAIADVLYDMNIPVVYEKSMNRFMLPEIRVFLSLLNIIDNPRSDVDLLSVLFFPMFGFSPDELSDIRLADEGSLYDCMLKRKEVDKKCTDFLSVLSNLRKYSLSMKNSEFVRYLINGTDYASMILAMPDGKNRLNNLSRMVDYAVIYENSGRFGYSGFVRYINKIKDSGEEITVTDTKGNIENAVKIMSIHKSKGLEFPYVIVADTAKSFNASDQKSKLLIDPDFGIALNRQERQALKKFETMPYAVIKQVKNNNVVSEELRLLYVALTRASVRLVISGCVKNLSKALSNADARLPYNGMTDPYSVKQCSSYLDMLLLALLRHADSAPLRDIVDCHSDIAACSSRLNIDIKSFTVGGNCEISAAAAEDGHFIRKPFTEDIYAEIANAIEYKYPHRELLGIPAKITASGFSDGKKIYENINLNLPAFVSSDTVGGTARGKAYHKFLQHCDFKQLANSVESELSRLTEEMIITNEDCKLISAEKIYKFIHSEIGTQIISADKIYREFEFRLMIPVKELYSHINSSDEILVQGVADLVCFYNDSAVVVDYKTDTNADEEHLKELYSTQLRIYKKAIEQLLNVNVTETVLYSISASKKISVS